MNYQKASTGLRLGASVGIIILMLGVAIALSIAITSNIRDQMKVVTDFNTPLEKTVVQINDLQKDQENSVNDAIKFLQTKNIQGVRLSEDEFHHYNNLINNEISQVKNIVDIDATTLPQDYVDSSSKLILTKINVINDLNSQYAQSADVIFASTYSIDESNLKPLVTDLKEKEALLDMKQTDLLAYIESSYQNIETSVDENKQKFLTLEIVIIILAGVISLASSHFVNQINKDLMREVIKKTKSLQKANEKLKKLNVLKDEFISEASHELKSPLNPIYGFVELAKCGDIGKEEALAGIVKQAHQIEDIANKMLDLGKIDKNRLQLSIEKFDLKDLTSEIAELARISLNKNITITTELDRVEIEADRVRIGQVIRNILNNAIKFTHEGHIRISSSHYDSNAEIRISDTGIGIHSDILPKLFQKFVTKNYGRENLEGNGLGLYICKGIIDAHGGNIQAYNNQNGGATIQFSIPIKHNKCIRNISPLLN
ncbi:MAG TPA: HAMP domain-containing sensor histidine kinase [Candidatus Nitrosotalea sp.]|nr:HAMP domain-containing sensor histidine kinase [Candidatus Nitrosotalea sp.]